MREFRDREEAGKALAEALAARAPAYVDPVILALPRGGVPIGLEISKRLSAPLDLVMVRKLGVPFQPELAAGAVVNGDNPQIVLNEDVCDAAGLSRADIDRIAEGQLAEIRRRRAAYLQGRAQTPIAGRTAIVVDDGIATGATMRAALKAVRKAGAARLVLAVPVAPPDTIQALQAEVDDVVCLQTPAYFYAIGAHYQIFDQVPDDEVVRLLRESERYARGGEAPEPD